MREIPTTKVTKGSLCALMFVTFFWAGCASQKSAVLAIPPVRSMGSSHVPLASGTRYTQWDEKSGYIPAKIVLPSRIFKRLLPPPILSATVRSKIQPANSVTVRDGGGQYGLALPTNSNTGIWEAMGVYEAVAGAATGTAYSNSESFPPLVNFVPGPQPPGKNHILYAPTTKPTNFGCLEFGIIYENVYTAQTQSSNFFADDWCTGSFTFLGQTYSGATQGYDSNGKPEWNPNGAQITVDDSFFQKYVRVWTNGNGLPSVQIEEKRDATGYWHLLMFDANLPCSNPSTCDINGNKYVEFASVPPGGTDESPGGPSPSQGLAAGAGWLIFETHYNMDNTGSDCPNLPTMNVAGIREQLWSGGPWSYPTVSQSPSGAGQCFGNGPQTFYSPTENLNDLGWWVTMNGFGVSRMAANDQKYPAWPDSTPGPRYWPQPPPRGCRYCE